ncbi:MAG: NUDIX hydrolase [Candidatus Omnitrophica bacterium]|nr:NUDIX hydrolase [Candidatus Omnitrophota bacterium]
MKKEYDGKLLKVYSFQKKLPTGVLASLEMIKHPGAALIVPFLSKTKIIMLYQFRAVLGKYIYELPAGTLETTEAHLSCAKREIIEETGYKAKSFLKLGYIYPVPGYSTEKIVCYKAERLEKVETSFDKDEVIKIKILTIPQLRNMLGSGKIVDAKTICALRMCGI